MDLAFVDSPLNELGLQQSSERAAEHCERLPNLSVLVVSPLHRAMQTAHAVLMNHPRRSEVTVIIDPYMREGLHWTCGIPRPLSDVIKTAKELFADFKEVRIDLLQKIVDNSKLNDEDLWFIDTMVDEDREAMSAYIMERRETDPKSNYAEIVRDYIKDVAFSESVENGALTNRMFKHKQLVSEVLSTIGAEDQLLAVGHCVAFFSVYDHKLPNCQMVCVDDKFDLIAN